MFVQSFAKKTCFSFNLLQQQVTFFGLVFKTPEPDGVVESDCALRRIRTTGCTAHRYLNIWILSYLKDSSDAFPEQTVDPNLNSPCENQICAKASDQLC